MTGTVSDKHPHYSEKYPDWVLMRDAYAGERQVKSKGRIYLPPTAGQEQDGMLNANQPGYKAYEAYKLRARFPGFVREAVQQAVGMMHSQPPVIELPPEMEAIRSSEGDTLPQLLRKINEEQLLSGRAGLLLDLPTVPSVDALPYIAFYEAETITNWDNGRVDQVVPQTLNLVVLEETEYERVNGFTWEQRKDKYRVLVLGELADNERIGTYIAGIIDEDESSFDPALMTAPSFRGQTLNQIPFVFINSCDLVVRPDEPPLLDLGNMCMTIYRGDADYRQNLFMQGQDTLVIMGDIDDEENTRVGVGAKISVPIGGDAKYIGVQSNGLEEQRAALENLERRAGTMGAQTLDSTSRERESGSSMKIRVAARTADLNQIAQTGAKGLEDLLKICAQWMGLNPDAVKVTPNLEFAGEILTGQSMVEMQTARNLGFPISARSMHAFAFKKGVTELTFEEELAAAAADEDTPFAKAMNGDRNPQQTADNPDSEGQNQA